MNTKHKRHAVKKDAGPSGILPIFKEMPLSNRRVGEGALVFKATCAELHIPNLEEPIVWQLDIVKKAGEPSRIADAFDQLGSRYTRALKDVPALPLDAPPAPAAPGSAIAGATEFGLQTDGDHEYFLSKFGELCGIIRVQQKADGSWKAGLCKTNLPRVLSKEAVTGGLMPPVGSSGLPKSLESVVPEEFAYWKQQDATVAVQMRDALVESGFFDEGSIMPVDGELRKVVTRHFLYEPGVDAGPEQKGLASRAFSAVPARLYGKGFTPMSEGAADWLEDLDKNDTPDSLAILSPVDRTQNAREMARAVKTLKGEFLIEHQDTRANRAAFSGLGVLYKLGALPDRIFCSSFAPACEVQKVEDVVVRTIDFQGIKIDLDRPKGFVQTGQDQDGVAWEREYLYDYGFFPNTAGGDGDQLDVFVGPNATSKRVFWVTQNKADGSFDEYKVFVGFDSPRDARDAFVAHIPVKFFAGLEEVPMGALKSLLGVDPQELKKNLQKLAGVSFEQLRSAVQAALTEAYPNDGDVCSPAGYYCDDIYDDHAIFYKDGKTWSVPYTYADGVAALGGPPAQVVRTWVPVGEASGATKPAEDAAPAQDVSAADKVLQQTFDAHMKRYLKIARRTLAKSGEERYVLGIVLEPDIVDAQQDTYSAEEIRQAADKFMTDFRNMGLMHKGFVNEKVKILESYIAPTDLQLDGVAVKKGTWMMAVRVLDDGLWEACKKGKLTGFSIGGSAIRKPVSQDV